MAERCHRWGFGLLCYNMLDIMTITGLSSMLFKLVSPWIAVLLLGVHAASWADTVKVMASIQPLALLAAEVGGDLVQVQALLPANSDPHIFALKISDRQRLEQADLMIWLGPDFERFLAKPMATKPAKQQLMLTSLADLDWPGGDSSDSKHATPADHHGRDLHIWLDPDNAALIAQAISARLVQHMPAQKDLLGRQLAATLARLTAVDARLKAAFGPLAQRPFGVYHDGYAHFVSHFGLQQRLSFSALPDQHLSARQLESARLQLAGASCVITDLAENNQAKLKQLLHLPVLVADPLAQARVYRDFDDYFAALGQVFMNCLTPIQ